MEKINEHLYQANIELVDKNKILEKDKKILTKRINKAIEYTESKKNIAEQKFVSIPNKFVDFSILEDILNILKGRYVEKGD